MNTSSNGNTHTKGEKDIRKPEPINQPGGVALVGIAAILACGFLCGTLATLLAIQPSLSAMIMRCVGN